MRKFALLIGNTNNLNGVEKDIYDFKNFLKSSIGGAWYDDEIKCILNIRLSDLYLCLRKIRQYELDYLIFYFSGHGGIDNKGVTRLEINSQSETISEHNIVYIAKRQLNILDCCRVNVLEPSMLNVIDARTFSDYSTNLNIYRQLFEKKILSSPSQHITLYSCDRGQESIETICGGVYTQALLESAFELSYNGDVRVENAHSLASKKIKCAISNQTPRGTITQGINYNQQLIFALKQSNNCFKHWYLQ